MRIRTGYSFKTAVGHLSEVADRLVEIGWKVGPITDRLSTYGYVSWTKICKEKGLKPIYGVELPVVARQGEKRPIADWWTFLATDELRPLHDAVLEATRRGGLTYDQACKWPGTIKITGERTLLEQVKGRPKDVYVGLSPSTPRGLYREAKRRGIKFIPVSDNIHTGAGDGEFYKVALGWRASTQTYPQQILSDGELRAALWYADKDEVDISFGNRDRVTGRLHAELKRATLFVPDKIRTLREECLSGAARLGVPIGEVTYAERLERELQVIGEKQFEDYFYIVSDLMLWARQHMVVGPARGSSCGSLVCYLLGITSIDPMKYDLVFERFVDVNRADLPDIDLDFSDENRHLALDYIVKKYGVEHTARLGSVNAFQAKLAIKTTAIALKIPKWMEIEVGNTVIKRSFGDSRANSTVEDTLKETDVGRRMLSLYPNAIIAGRLEDHPASAGQHAAGMVITKEPILDCVAINGETGATMCDKYDAEYLNLLKLDMLGLTQLSVFEQTLRLIGQEPRNDFLERLPLDDGLAFEQLNKFRFSGIFQFVPGSALSDLVKRLVKVERGSVVDIEDIIALTALVRPGPLGSGETDRWIRRKAGKDPITYAHPSLEPYLKTTLGIVVYQEQVMKIGRDLGGLSWEDVNQLRRAMSRSLGKEFFDKYGDRWKEGAIKFTGMSIGKADQIWDDLCSFGMWAFNRSHSVAYGMVSYWCCWLKAHHPVEFAAATLDATHDTQKQVTQLRELRGEGVDYLPFDPDHSSNKWAIKEEGNSKLLVGPLTNIKGIGDKIMRDILDARRAGAELRPSLRKRLDNAKTALDTLSPIADAVKRLVPSLPDAGIVSEPVPIGEIEGADRPVLVLARVGKIAPLNENEPSRVARRGRRLDGPTSSINMFFEDDSGEIFAKVDRFLFEKRTSDFPGGVGAGIISQAKVGKSLYAVKGLVPSDFRMIRIERIKYLGEM